MSNNAFGTFPQQTNQPRTNLMVQAHVPRGHGHNRKKKMKLVPVKPVVKKAKRPLNAYVAFRAYYQKCFASLHFQQKEISNLMGKVWQQEPFQSKWAIIAKAYSVLRDALGKENAPLDQFFAISCELLEIIEPAQYFVTMGWEIVTAENGEPFMHRNEKPLNPLLFICNFSVNTVICHCHSQKYFTGRVTEVLLPSNEAEMSMAVPMQATSSDANLLPVVAETYDDSAADLTSHLDTEGLENENGAGGMPDSAEGVTDEAGPTFGAREVAQEVTHETEQHEFELDTGNAEEPGVNSPDPFDISIINSTAGPAQSAIRGDAHEFQNAHYYLEGEYPYNEEFDPNQPATVDFDPFFGNQFDSFDVSDWDEFVDFSQYD